MIQEKDINLLKWYNSQGIDEIISNNTRTYTKKINEQPQSYKMIEQQTKTYDVHTEKHFSKNYIPPHNANVLARQIANKCNSIDQLKKAVEAFDGCNLKKTAMNTVFSDGNSQAKVMLIGEAPGANEDLQGIPFCGQSGQLLDNILKSINLDRRKNLYITNSIFWRPPGNRKPTDEEIKCCLPFVEKHIALVKPELIILAGSVATRALFDTMGVTIGAISKERQKILKYCNQYFDEKIATIVIYHPSYLLRQPSQKKLAWQDMLFIRKFLS